MNPRLGIGYQPARILIVDDEPHNRQLLEVMLTPEGLFLQTAASGEEALTLIARQPPDLILLDIMMPGMDGYQVVAKIKDDIATKNIPVIMVTALDDRNARIRGLNAGAEEFLTKPIDRVELCARVRNLLRLKAYADYFDKYSRMLESKVDSRTADLAERTKQAAVLAEQAALLDLAQGAIIVRDMHDRIVFWSRGAEGLYGWPSQEAVGKSTYDLLKTEFSEPTKQVEATLLHQGQWEGEAIHHKRNGTRVVVISRLALQRDADGTPLRILIINNDITDRKQIESERRLLTERLSLATAVAKVGVWEWDLASNKLTWDATMFAIYHCAPVVPIPYNQWSAAIHPEDLPAVEATLRKVIDEKGQGSVEYRIILPDGSLRTVSAVERAIVDEHANVSRLIGVDMDVTERKKAEEALEQIRHDQMRFKDEFLSHVSHELRSPLTAIKQFTSILLDGLAGELNEEQRKYQQIVLKNIRQLQSMIDDLLEVTRLETGHLTVELESVSVVEAVTDTFNTLQGNALAKGVALSHDLPPDLPTVYADPTRVRQALIILLDNAIKFTPAGGTVTIRARLLPQDPRFLLLEVSDTGCGINPAITERIFERLYQESAVAQTSRNGLGLGLYICKELVTRQGGRIWVESQQQQGSTFAFTLPVFSLDNVIAPLLKNDKSPAKPMALVMLETCRPGAWPSKESQEEWSHEARSLLQRCLLSDLDTLLPNMRIGVPEDRFFVAAFADEKGAAILTKRIRGRFERLLQLKNTGRTLVVSYRMLPSFPRDVGASIENLVTSMATNPEASIQSQLIPESLS